MLITKYPVSTKVREQTRKTSLICALVQRGFSRSSHAPFLHPSVCPKHLADTQYSSFALNPSILQCDSIYSLFISLNSSKCYIFARSNGVIANAKLRSTFHCGLLDLLFQRRANELLAYRSKTYRRNSNSNPRNPDFRWSTLSWLLITSIKPDAIISLAISRFKEGKGWTSSDG